LPSHPPVGAGFFCLVYLLSEKQLKICVRRLSSLRLNMMYID